MAGVNQTLTLDQFAGQMQQVGDKLGHLSFSKPLKSCKVLIVADVKENFAGGHTPEGQPWPPLAFPRVSGGDKPLRDRGILMASITTGGRGHIEQISETSLTVGTNLEYAKLHQEGGVIVPKRGKALAIPMTREASRIASPRDFPRPLFILPSGKALAEVKQKGRGGRTSELIVQYALVQRVIVPARRFLGFSAKAIAGINRIFADFLGGLVGRGGASGQ